MGLAMEKAFHASLPPPNTLGRSRDLLLQTTWLNQGRPDFVNKTDPTDGNPLSTGCAVLFLNYLRYQLNYRWRDIVAAAGQTLSVTYMRLTGDASNPFPPFNALLAANFPPGQQAVLNTDNPFPIRAARPQRRRRPGRRPEQRGRAEASLQDHEAGDEPSGEESEIAVMVSTTPVEGEASTRLPGPARTDAEETAEPDAEAVGDDAAPETSARTSGRFVGNKNSLHLPSGNVGQLAIRRESCLFRVGG